MIFMLYVAFSFLIIFSTDIYRFIFYIKINDVINSKVKFTYEDLKILNDNLYGVDCDNFQFFQGKLTSIPKYLKYKYRLDVSKNTLYQYCECCEVVYIRFVDVCVKRSVFNKICKLKEEIKGRNKMLKQLGVRV